MSKARCSYCGVRKFRVCIGRRTKHGKMLYTEGFGGRQWNGLRCPDCKKAKGGGKYVLKKEAAFVGPDGFVADPLTDRRCRVCNGRLPESSYFTHSACKAQPDYHDIHADYETHWR